MKAIFFVSIIQLFFIEVHAQDAQAILKLSYEKCQSVQSGYYEMTKYMKHLTSKDTSRTSYYCHFRKLSNDSIYSSAFHYRIFQNRHYAGEVLYTGNDFVIGVASDSSATIMSKSRWAKEIKSYSHNYTFYSPFTNKTSSPVQHDSDYIDNKHTFKFIGDEKVNGLSCFHIQVNEVPDNENKATMKVLQHEYHYWINQADSLPVKYSVAMDVLMNKMRMHQFEMYVLKKYEINNLHDENILSLNSIPSYYRLKDFVPFKSPAPLPIDTIAPYWELSTLTGERISLRSLRGQLVLIHFFYISCYPCMQALPALQSLHEKYKSRGLRIAGIDPYDSVDDEIGGYLSRRGITYTVLFNGKDVAKNYNVYGYPTLYLIDKSGNVIYVRVGFSKDDVDALEEVIRKNL
jgi:peroxiredoxin